MSSMIKHCITCKKPCPDPKHRTYNNAPLCADCVAKITPKTKKEVD